MTSRKHLTMATLRIDGSPRISGTEIKIADGQLTIGSMTNSYKTMDLRRDPRVAIHGPTHEPTKSGGWRGEAKVAGRALEVPSGHEGHAFRIEIREVAITALNKTRDALVIESWSEAHGYRLGIRT
jgi:Pyridoxamine 5'-phosphate oxidase